MRERLDEILETERRTLSFQAEDDARMREQFLDSLPPDPAGQISELKDYRFVDPEAQRKFDELIEWLQRAGPGLVLPEHGRRACSTCRPRSCSGSRTCSPS